MEPRIDIMKVDPDRIPSHSKTWESRFPLVQQQGCRTLL
jgi:hypothetical protein